MDEVKNRLKEALNYRGWTAADLARCSGVSKGLISGYLSGTVTPKQSKVETLANSLGVSPSWLLGFNVSMHNKTIDLDIEKLNELNRAKLEAYYQALLDSQGANDGDA